MPAEQLSSEALATEGSILALAAPVGLAAPADLAKPIDNDAQRWLVGGGEMGRLIRSVDWSKSPLGPIGSWLPSLRTTVSLCLSSNFPISLAWGPQHVQIYNDGYWPICGEKHPQSMGQDFTECWASPWPVIGEAFERALAGETSFLEDQRMFLDRKGYLEETFFTFSFSPIRDESGVAGLFHPVTETTGKMLGDRRARVLRDLSGRIGKAKTTEDVWALAAQTLADYPWDIPFALFYLLDHEKNQARLISRTGIPRGTSAAADFLDMGASVKAAWPAAEVARSGETRHIGDLAARFGPICCGEYPESVKEALALPVTPPGSKLPLAMIVFGVSPRTPLNETYRTLYDQLAAGVTSAVANARAYQEERRRAESLAEIDRAKTEFFSNVSHEFRTPLTLMLGPLEEELAEVTNPLPPERRQRLDTAHRNSLRLLKLVNSLLDFSRIEAGRMRANFQPVDLAALTAELASVFRSAIEKAGLTLTVDCVSLPPSLYIDVEMWEKIVLNLLSNAFKHTFQGEISVSLQWYGDHAKLTVKDTGVGIAAAELPRLFERFHRVQGAKSRTHEGTGIGLALVRELVSMHGGELDVQSEEGVGSAFTITVRAGEAHLPAGQVGADPALTSTGTRAAAYVGEALHWLPDAPSETAGASNAAVTARGDLSGAELSGAELSGGDLSGVNLSGVNLSGVNLSLDEPAVSLAALSSTRRPRVLWADDNADMRDYVRRLLTSHYDVIAVPDGLAALEAARESLPDLVLSDVMMPRLDGFGLLRTLRADARMRTIPVILLSARAGEESTVSGLASGADDYLAKPFSAQELLVRVRTHLDLARLRREWASELEQANKELEAFSYSVSHDLRAPLRAIDGFSKAVLDEYGEKLDAQGLHYLQRVRTGTQKMSRLINDLLALSRKGRVVPRNETVDLTEIARGVLAELQSREPERPVALRVGDGLAARGDIRLLTIVLENLLGNAWKFSAKKPGAAIEFGRQSRDGQPVYFVRDNGAGFEMAYANKLFSPFQRLHHEAEFEGTGIGLATVQRIIARHHGRVWAEGAVEQGATFYFTLEAKT